MAPPLSLFLCAQIFRQELEVRRTAIQHQQRQYGEGQDSPAAGAPAAKRQRVSQPEAATDAPPLRRRDSDDEDDDK